MYQVTGYVAAPDKSCKGVVTGIDSGTHSDELMSNLRSPRVPLLYGRMLGKSKAVLITFDSLEVPRAIYYYGGELRCRPYRPLCHICSLCLKKGHRADVCPTPEKTPCTRCGHENPEEALDCQPKCVLCGEAHPAPDPTCPARQRKPYNKSHLLQNARNVSNCNDSGAMTNGYHRLQEPMSSQVAKTANAVRERSPRPSLRKKGKYRDTSRDKSRGKSRSRSQNCPRAKTPRQDGNEPAPSGHELKLSSPTQASET
ncbi:hypothetical protein HPB48_017126 [Haemaphysalis longicornis]|uniref:Uncharacterized protein n=1 Tax=Haemaphysalis longicornis TaxID=44386 RepID=A0A9J6GJ96_HAELO|nr:hypothetical protein HPB48_017126 [Haemaphysalis longicornis]